MLFKEYKKTRLELPKYYNLLKTLLDLYGDELDDMLVYPQDKINEEYEDGRLLLIFNEKFLIKVKFNDDTVLVKPTKYDEVKYSFFREESLNPNVSQPGALYLNFDNEEIVLSPIEDFSSHSAMQRLDLSITIYKFLLTR